MYADETGAAVGDALAQHADARHAPSSIPAPCCSRARWLSEGRGTTRPFELVGAPWVARRGASPARLNAHGLPGVRLPAAPCSSRPSRSTTAHLRRLPVHVTDRRAFTPVVTGVALIEELRAPILDASRGGRRLRIRAPADADRHPGRQQRLREAIERAPPRNRWPRRGAPTLRRRSAVGSGGAAALARRLRSSLDGDAPRASQAFFSHGDLALLVADRALGGGARPSAPFAVTGRRATPRRGARAARRHAARHGDGLTPDRALFVADVYWQPPASDPLGPMALEVT